MKNLHIRRRKMKLNIKAKLISMLALVITALTITTPVYAVTRTAKTKAYYSALLVMSYCYSFGGLAILKVVEKLA